MAAYIATDHSGLTEGNFTIQVQNEIDGMKNNPDFPDPPHAIADIEAQFLLYKAVSKERYLMSPKDYKERNKLRKELNSKLRVNGIYIISLFPNNQTKQLSSRYLPVKERNDSGTPSNPYNINASTGVFEGEVKLHWKGSAISKGYSVRYRMVDSDDPWQYFSARKSRGTVIGGLQSGVLYEFWVMALGNKRNSDYAGPAEARAK